MKTSHGLWAWLLNARCLLFTEFGLLLLLLLAGRQPAPVGQHIVRGTTAVLLLVFLGHLHQYMYRFQTHATPLQQITKCIEPNKTMMVYKNQEVERFLLAWPPVLNNMRS